MYRLALHGGVMGDTAIEARPALMIEDCESVALLTPGIQLLVTDDQSTLNAPA